MPLRSRDRSRGSRRRSTYAFPYVRFHERDYPLIPLTLRFGSRAVNTFALLDSGASISVFRPEIAKALGLRRSRSEKMRLGTAGGGMNIALADVRISVGRTRFRMPVGFSARAAAHFNIIGREGFFERFSICFDETASQVRLAANPPARRAATRSSS